MYVCICRAVTDKAIKREIAAGACNVRALKDRLGLGSVCGRCVPDARSMIEQAGAPQRPIALSALSSVMASAA
jgi:bacterioferritin-associated ferredoxin